MGDLLGSPRVAPQSFVLFCFHCICLRLFYFYFERLAKIENSASECVKWVHKNEKRTRKLLKLQGFIII
jgi:hypothetical protein